MDGTVDAEAAQRWVDEEIARLRALSYAELLAMEDDAIHIQKVGVDGRPLILETEVFWDDHRRRTLRVVVDVWDATKRISWRSLAADDFIKAPDGRFIAE